MVNILGKLYLLCINISNLNERKSQQFLIESKNELDNLMKKI